MSLTKQALIPLTVTLLALFGQTPEVNAKPETPQNSPATPSAVKQTRQDSLRDTLREITQAFNNENLAAYMDILHPDSPYRDIHRQRIKTLFSSHNVQANINNVYIIEQSDDHAMIRYDRTFYDNEGEDYRDRRSTVISELRKVDGDWRFYATEIQNIEFLESGMNNPDNGADFESSDLIPERVPNQDCATGICDDGPFSER
ncbi:hypothetical protein PN462_02355 [Spirulina sp. CS-785/01]|uniref:hypothetical protein n=1 Tax=Spirulina sp. CS-785/01 TaxID=3021716 RepID=UPI0023312F9F|nr:hypothetical protein [Spirulina sp. CS-785/01]MDB9311929.1 hypothetical protein [Spirulina sp. CS-785/01]